MPARETTRANHGTAGPSAPGTAVRRPGSVSGFTNSRARILAAIRALACEDGYQAVSATAVIGRARVSSKTFYENFADTDECFIAAYDEAMAEIEAVMRPAYMRAGAWTQRVRAALEALLVLLESDRELAALVFLEAPKARELLRGRRARALEIFQLVLDSGRSGEHATETPGLIDELIVEGAISVIRERVASREEGRLVRLLDELMGVITYSYIGTAAVRADRASLIALPALTPGAVLAKSPERRSEGRRPEIRVTYRTLRVLTAMAEKPGASNRVVAEAAGIGDPGQASKLLRRLSDQELIRNAGMPRNGAPKRWYLTELGLALQRRGLRDLDRVPSRST